LPTVTGLQRDARQLLGGDAVVSSDRATPPELMARAQQLGLQVAQSVVFPSMARAPEAQGGATRLVAVKAVSPAYPLRGRLQLRDATTGPVLTVAAAPEPGTAWVDASLLDALQLKLGDPLLLGDATLKLARIIVVEPDRGPATRAAPAASREGAGLLARRGSAFTAEEGPREVT